MKTVLVDTDVLINFLRGVETAREFLLSIVNDSVICCSVITVAEIYAGMKEHEREKTTGLIDSLTVIDVTRDMAEKAGRYKAGHKGHSLELDDCLIAAAAFVKKAVLATGNEKHYPMRDIQKLAVR